MYDNKAQSRKWLLTINNPPDHGMTHDEIIDRAQKFNPDYVCLADEIGASGTLHTHVYLYSASPMRFGTVKKRFPTAHIDKATGTSKEIRDYVCKQGKWADTDKAQTSVDGTFKEFGTLPSASQEKSPKMAQLMQDVKDGYSTTEIIENDPSFAFKINDIEALREKLLFERFRKENRPVKVNYLFGDSGTGKTRSIYEKHASEDIYRITDYSGQSGARFDDYHGEPVIVFEEFHSQVPISAMLNFLDIYPLRLPARYRDRVACFDTVYITSNIPLEQQYQEIQRKELETWHAFLRRIHSVTEFRRGMPVTCGVECRVDMSMTALNGKRINNPDQKSIAYVTMHGIPHQNIEAVDAFFAPYREKRNARNRKMCENITALVAPYGLSLDFEADVLPISNGDKGGSVTERHILFALTQKIMARYTTPQALLHFLQEEMGLSISEKVYGQIAAGEETPQYYAYDILGALKSNMVEKFYVDATEECPKAADFVAMVHRYGGVAAYAYLGDVGNSVTGDKKAQKFEDDYLDTLVEVIKDLGFDAITYMPTRNTAEQLERLTKLCQEHGFFQISGEDINSPRQSFRCKALDDPKFHHLIDATYTLIGYEEMASVDPAAAKAKYAEMFRT